MIDGPMSDFFREVSEDVRRDRAVDLVKRFQWLIAAIVVLVIAATAAWRLYETRRRDADEAAGGRYQAALEAARTGKTAEAKTALAALATDGPAGYAALARLRAADLAAEDDAAAIAAYDALAAYGRADGSLRDLARFRAAMLRADGADAAAAEAQLKPLADASFPYHASVRELLALLALKRDDVTAAGRWLDQIVVDPQAPTATRERAEAFLGLVGSAAKPPKPPT